MHPVTGERIYRCNLRANSTYDRDPNFAVIGATVRASQKYPTGHYLDTGEKLSTEKVDAILDTYDQVELAWPWHVGDVLISITCCARMAAIYFQGRGKRLSRCWIDRI